MQELSASVARARKLPGADYRDVLRALKKEQLVGEAILPHYKARLAQIEDIIRKERLVTLPERPARIRLGTAAESAELPAPHMRPPRLIGNQGEEGSSCCRSASAPAPRTSCGRSTTSPTPRRRGRSPPTRRAPDTSSSSRRSSSAASRSPGRSSR